MARRTAASEDTGALCRRNTCQVVLDYLAQEGVDIETATVEVLVGMVGFLSM